jgi:hypothetical protein
MAKQGQTGAEGLDIRAPIVPVVLPSDLDEVRRVVFGELNYPHIVSISGYERHHDTATLIRNSTDKSPPGLTGGPFVFSDHQTSA